MKTCSQVRLMVDGQPQSFTPELEVNLKTMEATEALIR